MTNEVAEVTRLVVQSRQGDTNVRCHRVLLLSLSLALGSASDRSAFSMCPHSSFAAR
jgi:hypothetical protein